VRRRPYRRLNLTHPYPDRRPALPYLNGGRLLYDAQGGENGVTRLQQGEQDEAGGGQRNQRECERRQNMHHRKVLPHAGLSRQFRGVSNPLASMRFHVHYLF
jgi:hypothetical protein